MLDATYRILSPIVPNFRRTVKMKIYIKNKTHFNNTFKILEHQKQGRT